MPNSVRVEGLRELTAGLKKLDGMMLKDLKQVSQASAEIVAAEARSGAPVRSGRLVGNIKASGTQAGGIVRVGGLAYHRVIHFGWARHHIRPNPFLYKALDARRDEVVEKFEREVAGLVDRSIPTKVV